MWYCWHVGSMIACIFIDYFRIDAQEAAKGGYPWGAEPSDWDTEREGKFS